MVAKCANSSCAAKFLHLRDGAIFSVESGSGVPKPGLLNGFEHDGTFRRFQYFWLCPRCYRTMTLRVEGERVIAMRRERNPLSIAAIETHAEEAA